MWMKTHRVTYTEFCVLYSRCYCSAFRYFGLLSGSVFGLMQTTCHFWITFYALCKTCTVQHLKCNSLQYSCLEKPMDREAWWATVHGVTRVRHNLVTQPPITTHHHPVAQAHPTLCGPINCSTPDSFFHGISQARILKWVAISSSRESSWPKDITSVSFISYISGKFFTPKPLGKPL